MRKTLLWILAVIITLAAAVYQRMTGPTYEYRGKVDMAGTEIKFRLPRSAENVKDCEVSVKVPAADVSGTVEFKRYKTEDPWKEIPMERKDDRLVAFLPKQPMAGKLAYTVLLLKDDKKISLTSAAPIVIRFKGVVPMVVLIPHVLIMFLAMLFSTRAGLAALDRKSNPRKLALWAAGLLFIGGFILGPLVQHFGFGPYWTGFPIGLDLTDNKTLIAMLGWIIALIAGGKGKPARGWVLAAAILLLIVYSIPHSLLGSELDYSKLNPPAK